jgi:hypothetical protein
MFDGGRRKAKSEKRSGRVREASRKRSGAKRVGEFVPGYPPRFSSGCGWTTLEGCASLRVSNRGKDQKLQYICNITMLQNNSILKPLTDEELKVILKRVVWDYNISGDDLLEIYKGNKEGRGVNQVQLKAKLLNTYSWYKLVDMLGYNEAVSLLKEDIIKMLWPKSLRLKYTHVKSILL